MSGSDVIDHLSVGVTDLERAGVFYDAVLAALGYVRLFTHPRAIGYGPPGAKDETFALLAQPDATSVAAEGSHVAFAARDRATVAAFHAIALEHGAKDEGAPGLRPECGPGYYAAFARDLDGHRIEAVCHE
jgi:catechol 2,3-dioxygenase-like lactoylglutathione lyase family enzyme